MSKNKHIQQRQILIQKDRRPLPPHLHAEKKKRRSAFKNFMLTVSVVFGMLLGLFSCGSIGYMLIFRRGTLVKRWQRVKGQQSYDDTMATRKKNNQ